MRIYDTAEYAKSRLIETVIRHGDEPVMVADVRTKNDKIAVQYIEIMDGNDLIKEDYLENFNLDPVSLGYVNYKNFAYYLTRMPMRKDWRQGFRMLHAVTPDGERPNISLKVIGETIKGNYPSFKTCLEKISSKKVLKSVAFCRDFSIGQDVLEYKGIFPIGKVNMDNGSIHIDDNMGWTREALDESLEKAA